MTSKAEFPALLSEKGRVLGSMGIMTRTTFPLLKGYVLHIATGFEIRCFMALVTKIAALLCGFKGLLRCRRLVALFATDFGHNRVGAGFQEVGL